MERSSRLVAGLSILELALAILVVYFPSVLDAGGVPAWLAAGPAAALVPDDVGCAFQDHPMRAWAWFALSATAVLGTAWLAVRVGARRRVTTCVVGTTWIAAGAMAMGLFVGM